MSRAGFCLRANVAQRQSIGRVASALREPIDDRYLHLYLPSLTAIANDTLRSTVALVASRWISVPRALHTLSGIMNGANVADVVVAAVDGSVDSSARAQMTLDVAVCVVVALHSEPTRSRTLINVRLGLRMLPHSSCSCLRAPSKFFGKQSDNCEWHCSAARFVSSMLPPAVDAVSSFADATDTFTLYRRSAALSVSSTRTKRSNNDSSTLRMVTVMILKIASRAAITSAQA